MELDENPPWWIFLMVLGILLFVAMLDLLVLKG